MAEKSGKNGLLKVLVIISGALAGAVTVSAIFFHFTAQGVFLTLVITFSITLYHFAMRIFTGCIVTAVCRGRKFDYDSLLFREKSFERKLYRKLNVRKWKGGMITAVPSQFDMRLRTYEELLHNMTQAELVHVIIMILSFVPVFFVSLSGEPAVIIITSVAACLVDVPFVVIQRYNRPRIRKIMKRCEKSSRADRNRI